MSISQLVVYLITCVILLFLGSAMSASETALTSANKLKLQYLSEKGKGAAKRALDLMAEMEKTISALLVGLNIVVIVSSAIATWLSIEVFGKHGTLIAAIGWTFVTLIFGDIIPKTLAAKVPARLLCRLSGFVKALSFLLFPAVWAFGKLSQAIINPLVKRLGEDELKITEEDIKIMAELGEREGAIEEMERDIIRNVLEFTDSLVHEVMVPRVDMACIEKTASLEELVSLIKETGHSRIPVYEDDVDNIVGIIYAKDLLDLIQDASKQVSIESIMRPAHFVPETKKIVELLAEMQKMRFHIAIVVDEYGGTAGLVTVEDLLEEIVGEIQDEYDRELPKIEKIDESTYILGGAASIEDVEEETGISIPRGDFDTIGGFVFSQLGRIPRQGEELVFDDYKLTVTSIIGKRIAQLRLTRTLPPHPKPR